MKHSGSISLKEVLKRCRRYWRNETAYSISLPKYSPKSKAFILEKGLLPAQVNYVINISITLERHFNMPKHKALRRGYKMYMKHGEKFHEYMRKWFGPRFKHLTPEKALREQIKRGFTRKLKPNPEYPYIQSLVDKRYIWPIQYTKYLPGLGDNYLKFESIGVGGYTRIKIPKRLI